ncbi:MAG: FitA-like ribbon-helix-helix domain-containing protein [Bosea sp. (in: a-proteobacteria)]
MATLTIRNLPDHVRDALRVRAAKNGRSMEAEVREILVRESEAAVPEADMAAYQAAFDAAQADFAPYRNPKVLASDELIAERRLEAWRETVEYHDELEKLRRHG